MDDKANKANLPANPNRARDHLANERTYLAWIPTAVSLLGFGILIVKLRFMPYAAPQGHGWQLGLIFAFAGILMAWGANVHYHRVLRSIETATYNPEPGRVTACSALISLIGIAVLIYLFTSSPTPVAR